ncbi:MAG: chromate transporter [Butyricicoccus sp.]|nr:chromate transporter [Butyricicoccus sp.]
MIYLRLFYEFFKTGLFAVGGGMATLPFLRDMGARTGWFTEAQLTDMIAVSESTPGPIGVNMATYVGYETAGLPGGIIATLGLVAPSIIIILIIAAFLKSFRDNRYVERAFYGIRPCSTALIAAAGFSVMLLCLFDTEAYRAVGGLAALVSLKGLALFAVIWVLTNLVKPVKNLHPIIFIALSAAAGIVFRFAGA